MLCTLDNLVVKDDDIGLTDDIALKKIEKEEAKDDETNVIKKLSTWERIQIYLMLEYKCASMCFGKIKKLNSLRERVVEELE